MTYQEPSHEFLTDFLAVVEKSNRIAITAHISPDDDAIASVLSLYTILRERYPHKQTDILYTGEIVKRFSSIPSFDKVTFVKDIADEILQYDLVIFLDGNQFNRFSRTPKILSSLKNTICIDHHSSLPDGFTLYLGAKEYSATSEIIYWLFKDSYTFTPDIAKTLLLGIYADTGNFTYIDERQTRVFLAAKALLEYAKGDMQTFLAPLRTISSQIFGLIQELVRNTKFDTVPGWPPIQYSFISSPDMKSYTDEEISGASHIYLANYVRAIEGYSWGFVITPRANGNFRVSSRSLPGSVDVNALHESLGVGGGHIRAAGGEFTKTEELKDPKDCGEYLLNWLRVHSAVLV